MDTMLLVIILVSLLLSAMFSGIEIAFISADKIHVELLKERGLPRGRLLSKYMDSPSMFIATLLVGNTLSLTVYGIYMTELMEPWLNDLYPNQVFVLISQVIISTIIVLITAEFPPKSLFMINPHRMLNFFVWPITLVYYLMYPFVWVIVQMSKFFIVHIFKWEYSDDKPIYRLTDLNNYISNIIKKGTAEESDVEIDSKIFNNAVAFNSVKVRECMIPRIEIVAIDINDGIDILKKEFIKSGYSKILIYKDSIDNIVGYCHSSLLFKKPETIEELVTEIIIVPEVKLANELLIEMIKERKSIALVVDEFGGTSGIVTMEDVIEEIFGEIHDEHDDELLIENKLSDTCFEFSARHETDYLNEKYGLRITEGEYETLGGYILSLYQNIPKANDVISDEYYHFTIKSMTGTRIDKVRVDLRMMD